MDLPVVVLAGGLGTRLSSVSGNLPKVLVPVNGRPFIDWKIEQLIAGGAKEICFLVGYKGAQVTNYLSQNDYGIPIYTISDGEQPLGTASAVNMALDHLKKSKFILTYGDNLLDLPLSTLEEYDLPKDCSLMVVTSKLGLSDNYNVLAQNNQIQEYSKIQNSQFNSVDYGYSVFNKEHFKATYQQGDNDLSDIYKKMAKNGTLYCLKTELTYKEIGTPESLYQTELLSRGDDS